MKKRVGFVSNSSSSSFVLVFGPDVVLPESNLVTLNEYMDSVIQQNEGCLTREDVLEDDYVAAETDGKIKEDERFIRGCVDINTNSKDLEALARDLGARLIWLPM